MAAKNSRSLKKTLIGYWLYLDGVSSRDLFLAKVNQQGVIIGSEIYPESVRSEKMLNTIMFFLGKDYDKNLKGFLVKQSGGSYMQVRLITSTINALAFAWGLKSATILHQDNILKTIKSFGKVSKNIILPRYSGKAV